MIAAAANPLENLLGLLEGVKQTGERRWQARCPAHDDRHASLCISTGDGGKVLAHCQAGCRLDAVLAGVGLKVRDLFPQSVPGSNGNGHAPNGAPKILKAYDYFSAEMELLYQVVRYFPKGFRQRQPDGKGGWIWNLSDVSRVLYRLPELIDADSDSMVFVVEGEKDADRLRGEGLIATTNAQGAGKWIPEYSESLRGRHVAIIPDNDLPGNSHAQAVAKSLDGIAASVRVLKLPNLPPKGDVSDFLDNGGFADDLIRFAQEAPLWVRVNDAERALELGVEKPREVKLADSATTEFQLTDVGNAYRVFARHGDELRYCSRFGRWLVWTGKRNEIDERGIVDQRTIETIKEMKIEAARLPDDQAIYAAKLFNHALKSEANRKVKDCIERTSKLPGVYISPDDLDRDPWLFNFENGTLDLRAGKLRPHRRDDFITKISSVPFDPAATCPAFLAFLDRICDGNQNLVDFWHRVVGYTLTGITSERCLFILWGSGANGKSTLLAILRLLMNDYAIQTPASALMAKKHDAIPNDIARMKGARMVSAVESDEGRRLAEGLIKNLTGGEDVISARFMRAEWFDFKPEFKLFLATNHRPEIRGGDDGIWDRVKLIPFNVRIPEAERDPNLIDKLRAELPGIAAWAVRGCLGWQRDGLGTPEEVRTATGAYREAMDLMGEFLDECCIVGPQFEAQATPLFETYKIWCGLRGEDAMNQTRFGRQLDDRGFSTGRDSATGRTVRKGVGIVSH